MPAGHAASARRAPSSVPAASHGRGGRSGDRRVAQLICSASRTRAPGGSTKRSGVVDDVATGGIRTCQSREQSANCVVIHLYHPSRSVPAGGESELEALRKALDLSHKSARRMRGGLNRVHEAPVRRRVQPAWPVLAPWICAHDSGTRQILRPARPMQRVRPSSAASTENAQDPSLSIPRQLATCEA